MGLSALCRELSVSAAVNRFAGAAGGVCYFPTGLTVSQVYMYSCLPLHPYANDKRMRCHLAQELAQRIRRRQGSVALLPLIVVQHVAEECET